MAPANIGTTAFPRPVRLWPYQRAIADSIADAAVGRVVVAWLEPRGKERHPEALTPVQGASVTPDMTYRAGIEAGLVKPPKPRATRSCTRSCGGSNNLLAGRRDEPSPDKQQIDELRRTIKWVRRQRGCRERRGAPPARPAEPEPEPIVEEPPERTSAGTGKPWWGERCRGNHIDDLVIMFGACRADGDRWFWSAQALERGGDRASRLRAAPCRRASGRARL